MSSPAAKKARRESGVGATGPDTVVVLDYGSQYTQLITRRVRELGVYSVLLPGDADMVRAAEHDTATSAGDWDRAQKQAVVRMLHERGAFLLRGAVDDIADIMGVSRITIYNYLNAIEG